MLHQMTYSIWSSINRFVIDFVPRRSVITSVGSNSILVGYFFSLSSSNICIREVETETIFSDQSAECEENLHAID
jgi:hypothetical protein